ncbi:helix-turn-helix domain-containing protein [Mesorhizobium tianshanense]|uniref:Transcriptional regulator with XRE-family HTH domain n=1 Tax=Mesorhizobium tianshanense TaxID=39844 RepID=A0A562N703_9HYPH|nr:helix-turn-helix domain-containing protein [Mesorhizobium tianshanense]TWI27969.1 transcriptional regulator with XRE-family HTH domain [Mesorhizobium tianshanense]
MRVFNLTELGAAIRSARGTKGLSQSDLAQAIGATQEWISRLENGRLPNPGFANVMQACSVVGLGISVGADDFQPEIDVADEQPSDLALSTPSFLKRP